MRYRLGGEVANTRGGGEEAKKIYAGCEETTQFPGDESGTHFSRLRDQSYLGAFGVLKS
jgi:hypothetical protein